MQLDRILADAGDSLLRLSPRIVGDPRVEVDNFTHASDRVGEGTLFACVPGARVDGHDFAPVAIRAGAEALVVERELPVEVPQLVVSSVRAALGPVADALWGHPSRHLKVVGVTGTNGKTTTVSLLSAVFNRNGWKTATIGTLTQARTTPEAPDLQARLAQLRDDGYEAVAMEVSSHAIDQGRVDATRFTSTIWTNLSQDHLDYHGTMERYFEAKAALFTEDRFAGPPAPLAVVNSDDASGRVVIERVKAKGRPVSAYSLDHVTDLQLETARSRFKWEGHEFSLPLGGRFNVANALAAATCARDLGVAVSTISEGLAEAATVAGRFESVDAGQPFSVIVDYAHTPDGLAEALSAGRELTTGYLIVVFGAGGDRDHAKRPKMGEVAARLADLAVLTSDNPRSEDPQAIIDQVAAGAKGPGRLEIQADRADAISTALSVAQRGDVVVIAGKGHETGQDIGGRVLPFDDREQAREALGRILRSRHEGSGA